MSREADLVQGSYPRTQPLDPEALIAGRYRVLRKIGEGGMGVLYACFDTVLSREVAVKLLQRSLAAEPQIAERLLREAQLAAQLRRHVAQVFDCGMLDTGEPYIVMELLSGRDFYAILRESGPLSAEALAAAMLQVCDGLEEAHEKGIIHRDLKPENLFCATEPDGSTLIKIVDFGVSKQITGHRVHAQTNPTESVGSPQYMSPEQITTPAEVDARTDVWSLGVVMFELLTGTLPFNGQGPAQVCAAVLTDPVPPMSNFRSDVPPALEFIVQRCLEKNRAQRFASVAEVSAALRVFTLGYATSAASSAASGIQSSGIQSSGIQSSGIQSSGIQSSGVQASGVQASGVQASGVQASGVQSEAEERTSEADDDGSRTRPRPRRRWIGVLGGIAVLAACAGILGQGIREGRIRVPSKAAIRQMPARLAAWRPVLPWSSHRSD